MDRPYNLGVCTTRFNPESLNNLLRILQEPCEAFIIRNIEDDVTNQMDSLFIINPMFTDNQKKVFANYIKNGGNALYLISPEDKSFRESIPMLSTFGVKLERLEKFKKLPIEYLENYPKPHKRGTKNYVLSRAHTIFPLFSYKQKSNLFKGIPLIAVRTFLLDLIFSIKIVYGQGSIVVMSSSCLPDDRAEILEYLLTSNASTKSVHAQATNIEIKSRLPAIIEESFEVYQEVPLEVIWRKLGIVQVNIDQVDLLFLIEELIREGKLSAKIHGSVLVKY